jgi:alpha-tocopherol transfer protein
MPKILTFFPILRAFVPIPRPDDPCAPVTAIMRSVLFDPEIYSNENIMEFGVMNVDYFLTHDDHMTVGGSVYIYDLSNITMSYIVHYTPMFYQRMIMLVTETLPLRVKGIHCVNSPPTFQSLFATARSFMSAKMKDRVSDPFKLPKPPIVS